MIFGTNTTTVRGGKGSRRWHLTEGQTLQFLAQYVASHGGPRMTKIQLYVFSPDITTTTTIQGDEGSWHWRLAEGQTLQISALKYQPNFMIGINSMCTVPILRLLPITTESLIRSTHMTTMSGEFPHKILW